MTTEEMDTCKKLIRAWLQLKKTEAVEAIKESLYAAFYRKEVDQNFAPVAFLIYKLATELTGENYGKVADVTAYLKKMISRPREVSFDEVIQFISCRSNTSVEDLLQPTENPRQRLRVGEIGEKMNPAEVADFYRRQSRADFLREADERLAH